MRSPNILTETFVVLLPGKRWNNSLKRAKSKSFDILHNSTFIILFLRYKSLRSPRRIGNNADRKNKNTILTSLKITTVGSGFRFPLRNCVFLMAYKHYSRLFLLTAVCRRLGKILWKHYHEFQHCHPSQPTKLTVCCVTLSVYAVKNMQCNGHK